MKKCMFKFNFDYDKEKLLKESQLLNYTPVNYNTHNGGINKHLGMHQERLKTKMLIFLKANVLQHYSKKFVILIKLHLIS
jgi:hypothetical protein